jgi:hypothetical protein
MFKISNYIEWLIQMPPLLQCASASPCYGKSPHLLELSRFFARQCDARRSLGYSQAPLSVSLLVLYGRGMPMQPYRWTKRRGVIGSSVTKRDCHRAAGCRSTQQRYDVMCEEFLSIVTDNITEFDESKAQKEGRDVIGYALRRVNLEKAGCRPVGLADTTLWSYR